MKTVSKIAEIREIVSQWKSQNKSVGLVPTMGFLHDGHGSLIKKAVEENDVVIVSNFVNPTQFSANEDLDSYPRNLEADYELCESLGVDLMFTPTPKGMYDNPPTQIGRASLGKECRSRWSPYH